MTKTFEKYLDAIDTYLKPLPVSDRVDIVKEIKGSILEMQNENLTEEQILMRLGTPKDMAKSYLGDLLSNSRGISWSRFLNLCAFYSVVGFSGMFVIPVLGILGPTFLFCGIAVPIIGLIEWTASLFGIDLPYVVVQFGSLTLSPALEFVYCVVVGILLIVLGRGAWKLLLKYLGAVSKKRRDLDTTMQSDCRE